MNERLKQSLDMRLGGMRWGERDQAEVFRLAQRKELQDVKHVKRGTGMLALAIALLFIVMGAAFALTTSNDHSDNTNVAGQTTQPTFVPVVSHQYENDYFTLDVTSASWDGETVELIAAVTLKDPSRYALTLGGYTNPGATDRTAIELCIVPGHLFSEADMVDDPRWLPSGYLDSAVLDMTATGGVVQMRFAAANPTGVLDLALELTCFMGDQRVLDDTLLLQINSDAAVTDPYRSNELVSIYTEEVYIEGNTLYLTLNAVPAKPWYVINTTISDKSSLLVTIDFLDGNPPLSAEDIQNGVLLPTETGARMEAAITIPDETDPIELSLMMTTLDPVSGKELRDYFGYIVYRLPAEMASPTPAPVEFTAIAATATPAPVEYTAIPVAPTSAPVLPIPAPLVRSESTGEHIGGTDTVSVYLENSWYDGFSAEVTLRIRTDDPAIRLAVTPNLEPQPNENTWVVQLEVDWGDYYRTNIIPTLTMDESTGDVMVHLVYQDPMPTTDRGFSMPIVLRIVNEKTWQTETDEISIRLDAAEQYPWYPLYLVDSDASDTFIQAGYIVTDHYTYVGVMQTYNNEYPAIRLTDTEGNVLAADGSSLAVNTAIERSLFPAPYTEASQATVSVLRLEGTEPLPETLQVDYYTQGGEYLMHYVLSTEEPQPEIQRSQPRGDRLGGDGIISVYVEECWSDGFTTIATLRLRADDPAHRLAITPNANGMPGADTWVVTLKPSLTYDGSTGVELCLDAATGDILAYITDVDLLDIRQDGLLDLLLTTTNELTWEQNVTDFSPVLPYTRDTQPVPLHLVSTSMDGLYLQGSLLTTERYHYIGLMLNAAIANDVCAAPGFGAAMEIISYAGTTSASLLERFPKVLFPYDGSDQDALTMLVLRVDAAAELPDPLPIGLTRWTGSDYARVAELSLSTIQPAAKAPDADASSLVAIQFGGNVLFNNEYVTITMEDADFGEGHAFALLEATLKAPERFTTVSDILQGKTHLDIQLDFSVQASGSTIPFSMVTDSDDAAMRSFYLHAYQAHWYNSTPTVQAVLTLTSADGSIHEKYTAEFIFPAMGEVQLLPLTSTDTFNTPIFSYVSSHLAWTDYLSAIVIDHRSADPSAGFDLCLTNPEGCRIIQDLTDCSLYASGNAALHHFVCTYLTGLSPTGYTLAVLDEGTDHSVLELSIPAASPN